MTFDPGRFGSIPTPLATAYHTVEYAYRTGATYLVAALAYYALTALMPTILLAFVAITVFGEVEVARGAIRRFGDLLTPRGQAFLLESVEDVAGRTGIVVFAAVVAGVSGVQLFRTLDRAVSLVYDIDSARMRRRLREGAVVLFVAMAAGIGGVTAIAFLSVYGTDLVFVLVAPAVVFLATALATFPVYYVVPDAEVSVTDALPGTVFTAAVWALSGSVAAVYATTSDGAGLYGVLGGLLLVITWLYVANFALVLGVAINAVVAGRIDPRPADAVDPAVGE